MERAVLSGVLRASGPRGPRVLVSTLPCANSSQWPHSFEVPARWQLVWRPSLCMNSLHKPVA